MKQYEHYANTDASNFVNKFLQILTNAKPTQDNYNKLGYLLGIAMSKKDGMY
ncbi:hypothetical protein [Wolbachia pipientis]|uniref:hypothetical protein n=1 Tax=Wolbachia pipientis TaxID=955 RepID=UPI00164B46F4|nr:hypothetical protein [Wolbachia pipientis]